MNPAKIAALLETLQAACARQFRFNPRRVAAGMRYNGSEGTGGNIVHIFRDTHTHSQIELKLTVATLRERHGEKPHWTEAEKAHYRQSDAEIDAEIAERKAALEYTRQSALYRTHRESLLSHYKGWPGYVADGPTAKEFARSLVNTLLAAQDAHLGEFAAHMKTDDAEALAHLLLSPCHLEVEELHRPPA